eukprot:91389_1
MSTMENQNYQKYKHESLQLKCSLPSINNTITIELSEDWEFNLECIQQAIQNQFQSVFSMGDSQWFLVANHTILTKGSCRRMRVIVRDAFQAVSKRYVVKHRNNPIKSYQNDIVDYFKQNQITGDLFHDMTKQQFIGALNEHIKPNDAAVNEAFGILHSVIEWSLEMSKLKKQTTNASSAASTHTTTDTIIDKHDASKFGEILSTIPPPVTLEINTYPQHQTQASDIDEITEEIIDDMSMEVIHSLEEVILIDKHPADSGMAFLHDAYTWIMYEKWLLELANM